MRKKFIRITAAILMCLFLLMTIGCAAARTDVPAVPNEQQTERVHTGGMVYIPDRSVYFADVNTKYYWAFHEIDYLANTGILSGTGDLIYSPSRTLSRADFILMLYRAYDMRKYASGENFVDVPEDAYYADAVRAARALGIANGDGENKFYPNKPLTRQDTMTMLKRTLDRTNLQFQPGNLSAFSDADKITSYATEAVSALVKAGVIEGRDGKLHPQDPVTRAEMAVILYRALHLRAVGDQAVYLSQPAVRLVCIGSTIYADVLIESFDKGATYTGLYALNELTKNDSGYRISLGQQQPIDDKIIWDGKQLQVNGEVLPVAEDCEAIVVDMYSKREAGLCSTGKEYSAGAVSVVDGQVQTVYYKK